MTESKRCTSPEKDRQTVRWKLQPASLLPICSIVLKRISYQTMFSYFFENNFMSEIQSGCKFVDSLLEFVN